MEVARGMPLILLDDVGAGGVGGDLDTRGFGIGMRVSDLLCMSNLVHASATKEHDNDDDYQGTFRRAAERR